MAKVLKADANGKWPECDPSTVAPLNKDGKPDLLNHMPTRFVSKEEAEARFWKLFYTGESCKYGHRAPRYVSNALCVDCKRLKEGKTAIGIKGEAAFDGPQPERRYYPPRTSTVAAAQVSPPEPDALEKAFLVHYADKKVFKQAAELAGRTEAEFLGRLSWNKTFRDAVHMLENELGMARTASLNEEFDWTDEKRSVLIRMYVDTADLNLAMRAIGVTNYHFERQLDENAAFREDMEKAEALANRAFDRVALSRALGGDARLLGQALKAQLPDKWGEKSRVDFNVTQKLTDTQLDARLSLLFKRFNELAARTGGAIQLLTAPDAAIDADFTVVESEAEAGIHRDHGAEAPPDRTSANSDLV